MMNDEFEVRKGKTNFQFSTFDFQSKNRKAEAEFSLLPFLYLCDGGGQRACNKAIWVRFAI